MKALILAAGEGTRLRPLTLDRPKPMLPIGGHPILAHLIAYLTGHGIHEIAINLHYRPEVIRDEMGDGSALGARITYSPEERLLGSAGAVKRLAAFLDEPFVVLYGDVLIDVDLGAVIAHHRATGAQATILVHEVDDPTRCGIVDLDPAGRIHRFVEKPAPEAVFSNLANAGLYVIDPAVLDLIPDDRPSDFGGDVFPALLERGRPVAGLTLPGYILDIGAPERYAQAEADLRSGRFASSLTRTRILGGRGVAPC